MTATAQTRSLKRLQRAALVALAVAGPAWAASPQDPTWLSLEELMEIEVSSAAKRPQRLVDSSTAIYAIGRDEIRRSGATNLPELLRTVPGVQVSRIDASRYAVSIRGFSNRYSGKLLVLQDGRSLYNPLFSGTYWEAQDVLLADIERIEVIRGTGSTLWGANAVNGVINIITRHARDTEGTLVEAKAGSLEKGAAIRHGGKLGDNGQLRVYAKVDGHSAMTDSFGAAAHDQWSQRRAGFRTDFKTSASDSLTLQGDAYNTKADQSVIEMSEETLTAAFIPLTVDMRGANVLMRWAHQATADSNWHVQAYLDHAAQDSAIMGQTFDTLDLEWQLRQSLSTTQDLTWGLGMRRVNESFDGGFTLGATPSSSSTLYSGFLQDEIDLGSDVLVTLGSKIEHNENTGFEVQPSARTLWKATPTDIFWGAISRGVQTPTIANTQIDARVGSQMGPNGPMVINVRGNPDIKSENVLSRELGYRTQFGDHLNLDATSFYNSYDNVPSLEFGPPEAGRYTTIPLRFSNNIYGRAYGVELAAKWQVVPNWRLQGSYSWLNFDLKSRAGSSGILTFGAPGASPRHMAQIHSVHNLPNNVELDFNLYYTGKMVFNRELGMPDVAASTRLDIRMGWRPTPDLEISLTGRNLLDHSVSTYTADDVLSSQTPRSLLAQARWTY